MTQKELADKIGVSDRVVLHYESVNDYRIIP